MYLSARCGDCITGSVLEVADGGNVWGEYWAIGTPDWYLIDERPEARP